MANIFLDTNKLVSYIGERRDDSLPDLSEHIGYISVLSIHIIAYTFKHKIPDNKFISLINRIDMIPMDTKIVSLALQGPVPDFEDNVQLHSAAEAECDYFLTGDKQLLDMKFFGKMKMVSDL